MTDYQYNHYYIQKDGKTVSDFNNMRDAIEYVDKHGGVIVSEVVGELDCE